MDSLHSKEFSFAIQVLNHRANLVSGISLGAEGGGERSFPGSLSGRGGGGERGTQGTRLSLCSPMVNFSE